VVNGHAAPNVRSPVEIWGPSEVYILYPVKDAPGQAILRVQERGDHSRIYHREMAIYERIDPQGSKKLRATADSMGPKVQ
jgi:hypothetical protein